jgi:NitT/TauT family transport system substrate-binding protein
MNRIPRCPSHRGVIASGTALLAATALAACGSGPSPVGTSASSVSATAQVVVGVGPNVSSADFYLGKKQGYFAKAGLDVTPQVLTAGANAVPQLLSGKMHFAAVDTGTAISAAQQNIGITAIAPNIVGHSGSVGYAGIVTPGDSGITSLADLKGKKIAVNARNGSAEVLTKATLAKAGVSPSAVRFAEVPPPQMIAALQAGRVDAAALAEPLQTIAVKTLKMKSLANPEANTIAGAPAFVFVTSKAYMASHPEQVKAFATAILKANKEANDKPDTLRAVAATSTTIKANLLSAITLPQFGTEPLTAADIQVYLDLLITYGGLKKSEAPEAAAVITNVGR